MSDLTSTNSQMGIAGEPESIAVVYFGRRGGGRPFTLALISALQKEFPDSLVSVLTTKNSKLEVSELEKVRIEIMLKKTSIVGGIELLLNLLKFKRNLEQKKLSSKTLFIFTMTSPLDLALNLYLTRNGFTVYRFIHDHERHSGDIWPPKIVTLTMIKLSTYLVVLSDFIADRLNEISNKPSIVCSPPDLFAGWQPSEPPTLAPSEYLLIIGRIRKYKAIKEFLDVWNTTSRTTPLVVAGLGKISKRSSKEIIRINKWLSEQEIVDLVFYSSLVIFPYKNASQSGLIPLAKKFNKPIIASNSGGLPEQLFNYPLGLVLDEFSQQTVDASITELLTRSRNGTPYQQLPSQNEFSNLAKHIKDNYSR